MHTDFLEANFQYIFFWARQVLNPYCLFDLLTKQQIVKKMRSHRWSSRKHTTLFVKLKMLKQKTWWQNFRRQSFGVNKFVILPDTKIPRQPRHQVPVIFTIKIISRGEARVPCLPRQVSRPLERINRTKAAKIHGLTNRNKFLLWCFFFISLTVWDRLSRDFLSTIDVHRQHYHHNHHENNKNT